MKLIETFETNENGKDYVCGDIHGCFDKLENYLKELNFNKEKDRLFVVGDLIDRGPESERSLEYLQYDWFFSIKGNHEQLAIDYHKSRLSFENIHLWNGGGWLYAMEEELRYPYIEAFEKLPVAIRVGNIGLIHADIPTSINDWNDIEHKHMYHQAFLWGRTTIKSKTVRTIENIDKVYLGHTPLNEDIILGNMHFIDTGLCFGNKLTIYEI